MELEKGITSDLNGAYPILYYINTSREGVAWRHFLPAGYCAPK